MTVDYVQAARTEPGQGSFPEKYCCTVMIGGVNVAEALIRWTFVLLSLSKVNSYLTTFTFSEGLATVVRYAAGNDERSGK